MQVECTSCRSCASLKTEVEALKRKNRLLAKLLDRLRSIHAGRDRPRACNEITRTPTVRPHHCGYSLPKPIRAALRDEPCRPLPEVGAGAIVMMRCEHLRLEASIEKTDGCWHWCARVYLGYGSFLWDGKNRSAHRFMYTLLIGPIPFGMVIDHTCANKRCVNPEHLEAVTQGENIRRHHGIKVGAA